MGVRILRKEMVSGGRLLHQRMCRKKARQRARGWIGVVKNQPGIADCVQQLPDERIPSLFQFEKASEDLDVPVVTVNLANPRYIELRGTFRPGAAEKLQITDAQVEQGKEGFTSIIPGVSGAGYTVRNGDQITMIFNANEFKTLAG